MEKRTIGSLQVSVVGLGCNNFGRRLDEARTAEVVHAALDAGVNLFDTADIYGGTKSEAYLGRILAGRRNEVVLATKFGMRIDDDRPGGAGAAYVRRAVEESLRRLKTDRIDLYQLHTPDPKTPIAETLGALAELVREGKVREIGCSNFSVEQLREAESAAGGVRFVSVQNEYSLFHRAPEEGVLAACERQKLAFLPYFPLASGLLTGKYRRGVAPPQGTRITEGPRFEGLLSSQNLEVVEGLIAFAEAKGHTLLELAFSWLLSHRPVASVIAGATSAAQIRANAGAAGWMLGADELAEIDRIVEPVR